jgi:type II secretory pathway component PulF
MMEDILWLVIGITVALLVLAVLVVVFQNVSFTQLVK